MPRKIIVPPAVNKLFEVDGWAVFRHPPTAADSPLWVCLKVINLAALGRRHRRGQFRTFWLYWGVDERRFRSSRHRWAFEQQQPAVYAATVAHLAETLTPAAAERQLGQHGLAAERARLAHSRAVHDEHDRRRAAEAAAAAAAKE